LNFRGCMFGIDPDPRFIISIVNTAFTRYRYNVRKVVRIVNLLTLLFVYLSRKFGNPGQQLFLFVNSKYIGGS
jgi:hypothetical protein